MPPRWIIEDGVVLIREIYKPLWLFKVKLVPFVATND